jgi:hypothetical protein
MQPFRRVLVRVFIGAAVVLLPGCLAAAAGGAAGALYVTDRGVSTNVGVSVERSVEVARSALAEVGGSVVGTEAKRDGTRELHATKGDLDIKVEMKPRESSITNVEVTAQKNAVRWDKDFAKLVLQKIVDKTR